MTVHDRDPLAPPTGPYFFYGTLHDPAMLSEILDLREAPTLRPAHVIGYHLELWGQYPALVDGPPGNLVRGSVWEVPTEEAAAKLAAYETRSYDAAPCNVYEGHDKGEQAPLLGFACVYCGDARELSEGRFDLQVWLRRMGRKAVSSASTWYSGRNSGRSHPQGDAVDRM